LPSPSPGFDFDSPNQSRNDRDHGKSKSTAGDGDGDANGDDYGNTFCGYGLAYAKPFIPSATSAQRQTRFFPHFFAW